MNGGLIKSCELVARVRSGRVKQAGLSGIVMYNTDLSCCTRCGRFVLHGVYNYCPFCGESVGGEELRRSSTGKVLYNGETKYYI